MGFDRKRYITELLLIHVQGCKVGIYVDSKVDAITPEFINKIIKHLEFTKEDLPANLSLEQLEEVE